MTSVQLYGTNELITVSFPDTEEGRYAREFFTAFMTEDTKRYISNIDTKMYCLKIDDHFLPVTVNDTEYDNSYVTSPFGAIMCAQEELQRFNHWLLTPLLLPVLKVMGQLLKWGKINQVVTVNNWLVSTNLYHKLSKEQVSAASSLLQDIFPSHSILWRSLNKTHPTDLLENFRQLPCRLMLSRQIYFFDSLDNTSLISKYKCNLRKDQNLFKNTGYQVVKCEELTESEISKIRKLYDTLYLDKYTSFSPQFTDEFISLALKKKLLNIITLRKNGVIDGAVGYFIKDNVMTTPLLGYDTELSQEIGLYRMLTSILIEEARRNRVLLHSSSGAAHFKRARGMHSDLEYTAVFDQHLPRRRRIVWAILAILLNKVGRPILTHFKL